MPVIFWLYAVIVVLATTGCSRLPPLDDGSVAFNISQRTGYDVQWNQCEGQDASIDQFIDCAISNELTADSAIQIALLNNPKIQANFEEIGIARANWVEAGLLSNPSFALDIRYPHSKGLKTNIEYLITCSLLDMFLIPLRTKLACIEFEKAKLKVSNEILHLAFEVRKTYYELVAERKNIHFLHSMVALKSIINEIASKQETIGNINTLDSQLAQASLLETELQLTQSETEWIRLKEKLNRLLGFTEDVCLLLPDQLPEVDYVGFDLCLLESIALKERLDLQVARVEIQRLCQMLNLKDGWTFTNLRGGISGERETDGTNVLGPGFTGEIPIFNYGQADRMRLYAQLRQSTHHLVEMEVNVLSEVREAHNLLMSYLNMIHEYQDRLIPLHGNIGDSSEALYNVMGMGIDKLLESKHRAIASEQRQMEVRKKYLIARVELDRALGGYLFKLFDQMECVGDLK